MERILGIDYGDSKVGLAVNDELNITAIPIKTVFYKGDRNYLFAEIEKYIKEYNISKIVVGMPTNMNGTKGFRAEKTNEFIEELLHKFQVDVDTIDERLTTSYSKLIMNEINVNKKKKHKIEDTMCAINILQIYMDKLRK